ncbi:MAG: 4'-phosphopantetheinyl transferase superfamily protein [Clostridia bacterium]|nr:4'-phosphopantetheinyl transferase superfamily protein [Clostridia bacterium]
MDKAYLVLVDAKDEKWQECMHPLFSDERLRKIARFQLDGMRVDSACAELAFLAAQKMAFGGIGKNLYEYRENNKPYFKETKYGCLSFAHTRGIGACLIAPVMCGVDVEVKERNVDKIREKIRFRHAEEEINPLTLWCVKESFVKLTGEGLSRPFSELEFRDDAIMAEDGTHLAWAKTGKMERAVWAVSLEREMPVCAFYLSVEKAHRTVGVTGETTAL